MAEEIAERNPCPDFALFEPLFAAVKADMASGVRETRRFGTNAEISQGEFFMSVARWPTSPCWGTSSPASTAAG